MPKKIKTIIILVTALISILMLAYVDIRDSNQQTEREQDLQTLVDTDGNVLEDGTREFHVSGRNFEFSQNEMKVKKGDKVRVIFKSTKGTHDWVLDEFNARTEKVEPGQTTTVEFTANKLGTFEYYCSVGEHRKFGMLGKLIVEK